MGVAHVKDAGLRGRVLPSDPEVGGMGTGEVIAGSSLPRALYKYGYIVRMLFHNLRS